VGDARAQLNGALHKGVRHQVSPLRVQFRAPACNLPTMGVMKRTSQWVLLLERDQRLWSGANEKAPGSDGTRGQVTLLFDTGYAR
jgi:hypothetical protein